ncbi:flagellar hook-basal body complex protein [Acetobacter orientalis]|uniref:Flagellar hook protein FlgE n=1 Tax=Acetobacter orientalis TaxID=146474 RepID=A0A2Z5ZE50_9PROT|nr:flagellar hook-basal body complex protein [Acetobacter orientalis]MCP1216617.1 flagellar hook-basal body complex protein [Acetobacter orientalis]MCP1219627.1 flagellar hook-basal body complex protein [Acetobacter orientalis]BBC78982.1 flagellar hook protein FlgE [Acetobacter orientalis]GAN66265.1 flagellar hook protein FlgE [Acetobacter orientalis]GBR16600.1 flagellar hook protein FlgE [Acetobacter orientalis NRIC 0481]
MSVFNAISTAVSGINAQSTAFSNLSNNIANSQTVGYKADSTAFQDFVSGQLINSSRNEGNSDSVAAVTIQHVDKQGTATVSNDSLAMSIDGSGLFNVTKSPSDTSSSASLNQTRYYTRNGEFYEDKNGYLVNTSGYYLSGYKVTDQSTGTLSNQLTSVNVANVQYSPISNPTISVKGYVGSSVDKTTSTATNSQTTTIYDSNNDAHNVKLDWSYVSDSTTTNNLQTWKLDVSTPDTNSSVSGTYYVQFDSTTGAIQTVSKSEDGTNSLISTTNSSIPLTFNYTDLQSQSASMPFQLNLGLQGSTSGATLSSSTGPVITTPTTDSKSSSQVGSYTGVEIQSDGTIMAKFSLGDTQAIGQVALTNFASVNNLQEVSGQAYLATPSAGTPQTGLVGENGTGSLTVGYTESSTTDLTSDLSALIIAQQAYTANTKIVTTASELLQTTIAMKQ